jgi:hypothetical protein
MNEELPTVREAQAMFRGNPGLAVVVTESGFLHRDGRLQFPAYSTSQPE